MVSLRHTDRFPTPNNGGSAGPDPKRMTAPEYCQRRLALGDSTARKLRIIPRSKVRL